MHTSCLRRTCTALLTTSHCELEAVKSALRAAGVMWPHRPPPVGKRDLLRMMFHCDYALGWSAVFRVDLELHRNATTTYVLTDSGFNFVVRKYHERSTEAHREHYFNHLRDAFRDADGTADVVTLKVIERFIGSSKLFGDAPARGHDVRPLLGDLYKSEPKVSTVPDDVVYNSSANLSMQRWTEVMRSEGVDLKGTVEFRTWNLPFFSTFVNLLVRHGELDMYAYASWCTVQEMQQLEDMMFGPLLADLYKSAPKVSTVPDDVVYNASANLSMQRWTEVMRSEGVDLKGTVEFRTWNLPFFSTFVNLLVRHGELDMYAYASWCTVQVR
ncbi:hypothetical protein HPB51_028378 [Rhipicephalus microplus]|uniref:Uncharacterized protein n=1 Tax=Rhipicephalus microplus TaxID=6941 RepID=A0A9J6CXG9_RHIMP|nr:hypothetical protein HPB51_028378 [Rhipicephalus microplus]